MFDNVFNTTLFALVTAVAVAAAVEIVHTEVDLERAAAASQASTSATASVAGASQQVLAQAEPLRLPTVVVTGRHQPDGAPASAVAELRSATTAS